MKNIYAFETPSSTEWNFNYQEPFTPNVYFDVTDTLDAKIKGMAYYRSESTEYPYPRSAEGLRSLGRRRGTNVGFSMAEAFILLRACIDKTSILCDGQ